jgi:plastocyanin
MSGADGQASATRWLCSLALGALAVGQLVAYLVLTGEPNPGIASTAVLPAAAALAVLLAGRAGPVAALLVVVTIVWTRTTELSFDLARPDALAPFALAVGQLTGCGVAAACAVRLLLPPSRPGGPALPVLAGLAGGALVGATLLVLLPQDDLTGGLTDDELSALPQVALVDYRFEPAQLRVAAGEPLAVVLSNEGARPHAFTVPALDLDVLVPSGRSRTVVVRLEPGSYDLTCSVGDHEQEGMKGRVVVGPSSAAAAHDHQAAHGSSGG